MTKFPGMSDGAKISQILSTASPSFLSFYNVIQQKLILQWVLLTESFSKKGLKLLGTIMDLILKPLKIIET